MANLASINIRFAVDLKQFSTEMANSLRTIDKFGQKLQSVGSTLSIGVTAPILAFGVASVLAFDQSAQAIAQVEAALKSTGGVIGYNSEQLQKMAADLQSVTTFDDDEILKKATANLLTFSKITGTTFQDAQKAALDLATRLDGDLQAASIQVGKALNDPIKGISALSRVGVSFSVGQKEMIQSMVDTNNLAGAQAIILAELQKEFGGSAEAAAKAGLGGFKQLGNMLGDLSEDFGKIILEAIQPFLESIKSMVSYLKELTPEAKMTIAVVAGIAAAIGPLTLGIGVVLSMLPTLIAGFTALTGPIGLTVLGLTAVAVVIVKNWAPIKKILVDVANYFIDLYNNSTLFRGAVEYIGMTFKNMWAVMKLTFNNIIATVTFVGQHIYNIFKTAGSLIKSVLTLDIDGIKKSLSSGFSQLGTDAVAFFRKLADNGKNTAKEVSENVLTALNSTIKGNKIAKIVIPVEVKKAETPGVPVKPQSPENPQVPGKGKKEDKIYDPGTIAFYEQQISLLKTQQSEVSKTAREYALLGNEIAAIQEKINKISPDQIEPLDLSFILSPETLITISGGFAAMETEIAAKAGGIKAALDSIAFASQELRTTVADAALPALTDAFSQMGAGVVASLGLAKTGFGGFISGMLSVITKLIAMMLASAISQSIAGATSSGTATGPAAVFTTPAFIATAVGGVLAAFMAIPKFATGGIVSGSSLYGDKILARVNSGEMIANSSQQKKIWDSMSASNSVNVTLGGGFEIDGNKLRLVLDRTDKRNSRIG